MSWTHLDKQLAAYEERLRSEIKLSDDVSDKLATTIAAEVHFLPRDI